ncbi:M20 family metallopeptidase [Oscillibacter sp.]|uniref:M20 metallopeptidase family protein n=1 Tax=Oscillibacter sp. TaxID=1945593 RepID=UPI002898C860|nr:M20 family metallopeptidase [Oscillibacter sp.]
MFEKCKELQNYIVAVRRELHRVPEIGMNLPETQAIIARELDKMGVTYKKNQRDSGIIGEIKGAHPGKTILLRADIDGLPITEATGVDYTSKHENCMHACGHDAHGAMLLGALKVLQENRENIKGAVRFVFQTGEEICRGARVAIEEGVLDGVDNVFGLHIGSIAGADVPAGTLVAVPGCCLASFDRFILRIRGAGCHGSTPEKGVDPITIAANITLSLQEILAREIPAMNPAVLTLGKIAGGAAYNVIPGEVVIEGTTRALDDGVRKYLAKRIGEISKSVAEAYRGICELEMDWGAPPVVNDPAMTELAQNASVKALGQEHVMTSLAPLMGGEDFAYYLIERPGAFMFLSSANPQKHTDGPHHNSQFNIDEDVLYMGSAVFVSIVEEYFNS